MTGVTPAVVLMTAEKETRFVGKPVAGRPGVYEAKVVFPEQPGTVQYEIDDGFTNAVPHTFPPIEVKAAPAGVAPSSGDFPFLAVLGGAALALLLAAALVVMRRRRGVLPA